MITRRTILKTAAWTAPVVAIGVAAPAEAASTPVDTSIIVSNVCKFDAHNGGKGKALQFNLASPVFVISVTIAGFLTNINQFTDSFTSSKIPNKYISGPNTVIVIEYSVSGQVYNRKVNSTIPDCHSEK